MLQFFRGKRGQVIVFAMLGLVLIAIVVTGFGTGGSGLGDLGTGPARLATVGGEPLSERDFNAQLNLALEMERRRNPQADMAGLIRAGAFEQLLDQTIGDRAQIAAGEALGLAVSKRMVDGRIASLPQLQDAAGNFDENAFRRWLSQNGVSESLLRNQIVTDRMGAQLLLPVMAGARVPNEIKKYYAGVLLETRTGAIGAVPLAAVGPGTQPTEADIAAQYKAKQARYMIPERRVLRYALINRADVAAAAKATDAEIEAAYKADPTYGPRETRGVTQLTLGDQAAASAFAAKVKAGKSFADAAKEAGFTAADIGHAEGTRAEVAATLPPEITDAAFKAGQGTLIGPIKSAFGWHVGRVEKAASIPAKPLAAVRGEIATKIETRKANEALAALTAKIEDAIADDGINFDEAVRSNNLTAVETQPVTAAGIVPLSTAPIAPEAKALLKAAFDMASDDPPLVETIKEGEQYALLAVSRIVPPTAPPLAQVHDRIRADIVRERSAARAKQIADRLVAQINGGTPVREAFAKAGVPLPPVQTVTMKRFQANQAGEKLPPPVRLMFSLPKGKAKTLPAPQGSGWFVVIAEQATPGAAAEIEPLLKANGERLFDQPAPLVMLEQMTLAAEREAKVRRNQGAINALKAKLAGGNRAD